LIIIAAKVPEDLAAGVRARAAAADRTVSAEVRRALRAHMGDTSATTSEGRPAQATSAKGDDGAPHGES
jgi:plasmid stability protein